MSVARIAEEVGTPAFVLDEDDFRARARAFRDAFAEAFRPHAGADVYYAGKAFLCSAVARWVMEEGLGLDTCSAGELAVAQRVGFPAERIALHGNNKSVEEIDAALAYGVGRIVVDSFDEAIEAANGTEYGLASGIWTSDVSRAHRVARELAAGTVWVNTYRYSAAQAPFGGVKQSGLGREGGAEGIEEYTSVQYIGIADPWAATKA